jgi:hypothetical protein
LELQEASYQEPHKKGQEVGMLGQMQESLSMFYFFGVTNLFHYLKDF